MRTAVKEHQDSHSGMTMVTRTPCFTQMEIRSFGHVGHHHLEPNFPASKKKMSRCQQTKPQNKTSYYFLKIQEKGFSFLFLLAYQTSE